MIAIVALVVLGPERLPHAIRSVAKFVSAAKSMANSVKDELAHELKVQELQENLRKAEQMGMQNLSPELQKSVESLKQAAQEVQRPYAATPSSEASSTSSNPSSATEPDGFASIVRRNRRKKGRISAFLSSLYQELS